MYKKSKFLNKSIRELTKTELTYLKDVENVLGLNIDKVIISEVPKQLSDDCVSRPLILTKQTVTKIKNKHGKINPVNLLINANDWDIAIKNMDKISGKICLIKEIPGSENILLIGALRVNGYFVLSHYEVEILKDNQLKSLLGRGDVFESGRLTMIHCIYLSRLYVYQRRFLMS